MARGPPRVSARRKGVLRAPAIKIAAHRRELPWVKVDKTYTFESVDGPVTLAGLFKGKSQLIVYHFMFGPGWEEGCKGCSFVSDHFDGALPNVAARDISFAAVSIGPLEEFQRFKERMGWKFNWVSSQGSTFNRDFHVSFTPQEVEAGKAEYNYGMNFIGAEEMPGLSVFARGADGTVYHTYSTYGRGLDLFIGAYNLIDLAPMGRNEDTEAPMKWVKHHDRYAREAVAG